MAQAQYSKGNKLVKESKDQIMTTLQIKNASIILINGKEL